MTVFMIVSGVLALLGALYLAHWFVSVPAGDLARALRTAAMVFMAVAGSGLLFAGRWALAVAALLAGFAAWASLRNSHRGADSLGDAGDDAHASTVTTDSLRMSLNHVTGELDGEVIDGPHRGRVLSSLGLSDLLQLLMHCRIEDPGSLALLETYLDRRFPDWREARWGEEAAGAGSGTGEPPMDEARAYGVLGLQPGAFEDEIRAAHRRLMARFHPDAGGSNYLAAEINRAKDFLLRRHR